MTRHRLLWLAGATALTGTVLLGWPRQPPPPSLPAPAATGRAAVLPGPPSYSQAAPRTPPARVIIPAIGVSAAVVPEGLSTAGALEVPPLTARNVAGWWDGGAAPGQDGPAVIDGHVDSAQAGPLVFWNLRLLKPGDLVETEPGSLRFTVTSVTQVSKPAFPVLAVYGPTKDPELRLVTCGGTFDDATGHYLSNVIVYARETTGGR